jgi:MFS family permease
MTHEAPPMGLARDPDWRLFWLSTTVSVFGSQVSALAIPLTAIDSLDAPAFQIGLLNASLSLPFLLIGLLAGAWVDRMRRRPLLIVSDILRGLLLVSVPTAFLIDALSMVQLYAVGLLFGCLTVFFDVAYDAYVPALVGRERLVSANSMIEVSRSSAQVVGPGVAGLLIGIVGAPIAVLIDALSFLMSGGLIAAIRRPETEVERAARAPGEGRVRILAAEIGEGLRYVLGHRYLRAIAACTATFNFFSAAVSALFLLYTVREIGLPVELIGLIFAVGSLGLFGGIWLASRLPPRIGVGPTIITGILISGPAGLIVPLAPAPLAVPLFIAFELLLGVGLMVYNINQRSLRQAITPPRMLARMTATMRFLVFGSIPLGAFLGGLAGDLIGLRETLWIAAIGGSLAFVPIVLSPVRSLHDVPPAAE